VSVVPSLGTERMPPDSALKAREPVARLPSFSALVALGGVAGKLRLDRIPQRPIDGRRVLARIGLSVVKISLR
jgi:hypothetical protein